MRFLVNLFNHAWIGQQSLHDIFEIFGRQLESLGHSVEWYNDGLSISPDVVNIVFEGFHAEHVRVLENFKQRGARIVVVATEEPTEKGFNHGLWPEMVERQKNFHMVDRFAEAIWYLVPGTGDWYGQFGIPAYLLELGYSPRSMRHPLAIQEYDFGFFGTITERRYKLLEKLASQKVNGKKVKVRVVSRVDEAKRDREMAGCKALLQIRAHEPMGLLSNSRCCTAMHLGRPILAESHANPGTWENIIKFSDDESFMVDCIQAVLRHEELYAEQFERYRELLSPERCMGKLLRETFDI